jgi:putative PIN family toxin of toxin-antitoxin system
MRVVIDTNVVASAIFFGGKPKEVIDRVMTNQIDAYASADILEEYSETVEYLKDKFPGKKPKIPLIDIEAKCRVINVSARIDVCRDPDDNKFIECAIDSKCYYVISGDKDLLTVKEYDGIEIVTVAEFLEILKNNSNE